MGGTFRASDTDIRNVRTAFEEASGEYEEALTRLRAQIEALKSFQGGAAKAFVAQYESQKGVFDNIEKVLTDSGAFMQKQGQGFANLSQELQALMNSNGR